MPFQDREAKPRSRGSRRDGDPPDENPLFGAVVVAAAAEAAARPPREGKPRPYIRPSDAMSCARKLSYIALGVDGEPMDGIGAVVTNTGTLMHEWADELLGRTMSDGVPCPACTQPGPHDLNADGRCSRCDGTRRIHPLGDAVLEFEVPIGTPPPKRAPEGLVDIAVLDPAPEEGDIEPVPATIVVHDENGAEVEVAVYGFIDLLVRVHDSAAPEIGTHSVDFKSINGFSFKKKVGDSGEAEGADVGHKIQAGIGALAYNTEWVRVLYLSKEAVSKGRAKSRGIHGPNRIVGEWSWRTDDIRAEIEAEALRMWRINRLALTPLTTTDDEFGLTTTADGALSRRMVPGVPAEIEDPMTGGWVLRDRDNRVRSTGNYWACEYCGWREQCAADGPGRVLINPTSENDEPGA